MSFCWFLSYVFGCRLFLPPREQHLTWSPHGLSPCDSPCSFDSSRLTFTPLPPQSEVRNSAWTCAVMALSIAWLARADERFASLQQKNHTSCRQLCEKFTKRFTFHPTSIMLNLGTAALQWICRALACDTGNTNSYQYVSGSTFYSPTKWRE